MNTANLDKLPLQIVGTIMDIIKYAYDFREYIHNEKNYSI